jgi:hypothetical protein
MILEKNTWISVGKRLPETPNAWPVQVLIYLTIAGIEFYQTAKFYKDEWTDDAGHLIEAPAEVIAWMPILPYTQDEGKEQG